MRVDICIDVDDVARAVALYRQGCRRGAGRGIRLPAAGPLIRIDHAGRPA